MWWGWYYVTISVGGDNSITIIHSSGIISHLIKADINVVIVVTINTIVFKKRMSTNCICVICRWWGQILWLKPNIRSTSIRKQPYNRNANFLFHTCLFTLRRVISSITCSSSRTFLTLWTMCVMRVRCPVRFFSFARYYVRRSRLCYCVMLW